MGGLTRISHKFPGFAGISGWIVLALALQAGNFDDMTLWSAVFTLFLVLYPLGNLPVVMALLKDTPLGRLE